MIRNKEFRYSLYLQIAIVVLLLALINRNYLSGESAITILGVLTIVMQFIVAKYRYDKIRDLEEYVRMFEYRKSSLGVLDNEEGELSILKNTLYKLCMTLLHQKELLQQDKEYLADAISDISHQLKTPITSILELMDLLKMANERYNETLVVITHDESVALQADRIITIEDGKIKKDEVIRGRGARGRQ